MRPVRRSVFYEDGSTSIYNSFFNPAIDGMDEVHRQPKRKAAIINSTAFAVGENKQQKCEALQFTIAMDEVHRQKKGRVLELRT